jgi:hypothetical protein
MDWAERISDKPLQMAIRHRGGDASALVQIFNSLGRDFELAAFPSGYRCLSNAKQFCNVALLEATLQPDTLKQHSVTWH